MTRKRVTARSATSARRKAGGPRTSVTKVNMIPNSERKGMKTYDVTTKKKRR